MTMKSRYEGTRMFDKVTRTWNVVTGCSHQCVFCWVRNVFLKRILANPRLARFYNLDFSLKFNPERLNVRFRPSELVFVVDAGDLFCDAVPDEWILKVLEVIRRHPRTDFLLLTKNPQRYLNMMVKYGVNVFTNNIWFGTTIETDNDELYVRYGISRAPKPSVRMEAIHSVLLEYWNYSFPRAWISIEPIIDFTSPRDFAEKIAHAVYHAHEVIAYIGYDNYGFLKRYSIPEPPLHKTMELIDLLKQLGIEVRTKTLRKAWNEHQHHK